MHNILARLCVWVGLTVIAELASVQLVLNFPTRTELETTSISTIMMITKVTTNTATNKKIGLNRIMNWLT